MDTEQLRESPQRVEAARVVVVAGDQYDLDLCLDEGAERRCEQPLGLGRWRSRVVDVAADEDDIDASITRDGAELGQHRFELDGATATANRAAEVPVGGVQEAHA